MGAYGVTRRTREIGIRAALGAGPHHLVRLVLGRSLFVVATGLAAGLALSWAGGRILDAQLFDVTANDPRVLAACGAQRAGGRRHRRASAAGQARCANESSDRAAGRVARRAGPCGWPEQKPLRVLRLGLIHVGQRNCSRRATPFAPSLYASAARHVYACSGFADAASLGLGRPTGSRAVATR